MNKTGLKFVISGSIPLDIIQEAGGYTAISPVLNLASQGKTIEEAKTMFEEALVMFLGDIWERGTWSEVLQECGWKFQNNVFYPPQIVTTNINLPSFA